MHQTVERAGNRAKRELIAKFPPAGRWAQARHDSARERWRTSLPPLSPLGREQLATVAEQGILLTRWRDLGLPGLVGLEPLLLDLAGELAGRPARPEGSDSSIRLSRDEMLQDDRLWRWGLQDEVLDLVENHLGVPAHYYGPLVHRELADARVVSTRQWHRDIEDRRVLKLLVWLDDVGPDGGPFTYAPLPASREAARRLRYAGGFVPEDRFAAVVPRSSWRQAVGPRWTAVVPDTAQVFHRAQPPVARDRYSVTFTWMSRTPLSVIPSAPWTPDQRRRATQDLGPRQLAALPLPALA